MNVPLCPSCQRTLLSRMSPLCNRCGAPVPAALLYTAEERKRLQAEDDARDARMKANEREHRERWDGGGDVSGLF